MIVRQKRYTDDYDFQRKEGQHAKKWLVPCYTFQKQLPRRYKVFHRIPLTQIKFIHSFVMHQMCSPLSPMVEPVEPSPTHTAKPTKHSQQETHDEYILSSIRQNNCPLVRNCFLIVSSTGWMSFHMYCIGESTGEHLW